ncbi:MAG: phosphoribosylanthranilate isomerase [Cyclobacteriaceae bacterium]
MALKTFVKISKIDNLSDARYCAGMMVDILGFNLEEGTEGFVDNEKFTEITNWLAGVKFCGEFKNAHTAEIKLAVEQFNLDYVEVQNLEQLEELQDVNVGLIYKAVMRSKEDLESLPAKLEMASELAKYTVVATTDYQEETYNSLNKLLSGKSPVIIGYTNKPEDVESLLDQPHLLGLELEGSPEERPGFKDYDNVMDILELLED